MRRLTGAVILVVIGCGGDPFGQDSPAGDDLAGAPSSAGSIGTGGAVMPSGGAASSSGSSSSNEGGDSSSSEAGEGSELGGAPMSNAGSSGSSSQAGTTSAAGGTTSGGAAGYCLAGWQGSECDTCSSLANQSDRMGCTNQLKCCEQKKLDCHTGCNECGCGFSYNLVAADVYSCRCE